MAQQQTGATKEKPFVNSLGMKLVAVPGTKVLFSIWDTRVRDYRAYAKANPGADAWFVNNKQGRNEPVIDVSWDDAKGFCAWLTKKERKEGRIGFGLEYRLPMDKEWSVAVGKGRYPWGNQWPPPRRSGGAGNYYPTEKERYYFAAFPVGSFPANQYGLYDMGGNVSEWCEDWYRSEMNGKAVLEKMSGLKDDGGGAKYHMVRGPSWRLFVWDKVYCPEIMWSSCRMSTGTLFTKTWVPELPITGPINRGGYGFRCVLAEGAGAR
jgi:formylglycine-generating enzyme required for sulfatase activity